MSTNDLITHLCYEIEAHSPMVINMSPDERAELFKAIQEAIPIKELLEVARAARELVGGPHRHVEGCNCEHCALLKALAALRRKLPKGVL